MPIQAKFSGNKTRQGFYTKKTVDGRKEILYFDYTTGEYKPIARPKYPSALLVKQIDDALALLDAGKFDDAKKATEALQQTKHEYHGKLKV